MYFIAITIANLIWILFSLTEGVKDGIFSHYSNNTKRNCLLNSSRLFNLQRILMLMATAGLLVWTIGVFSIPFIIGQYFMFKYFRKISYDATIKKIQINLDEQETKTEVEKKINTEKKPMLIGVFIQIFSYIFLM